MIWSNHSFRTRNYNSTFMKMANLIKMIHCSTSQNSFVKKGKPSHKLMFTSMEQLLKRRISPKLWKIHRNSHLLQKKKMNHSKPVMQLLNNQESSYPTREEIVQLVKILTLQNLPLNLQSLMSKTDQRDFVLYANKDTF